MQSQNPAALQTAAHDTDATRTDPRPDYIPLGVDGAGAHHVWDRRTDTIHIVHDDGSRGRRLLGDHSVDDWMAAVDDAQGWASRRYGSFTDCYADQLATLREGSA
jgi:hypothetical protein